MFGLFAWDFSSGWLLVCLYLDVCAGTVRAAAGQAHAGLAACLDNEHCPPLTIPPVRGRAVEIDIGVGIGLSIPTGPGQTGGDGMER